LRDRQGEKGTGRQESDRETRRQGDKERGARARGRRGDV
jgi:hypothetical protein